MVYGYHGADVAPELVQTGQLFNAVVLEMAVICFRLLVIIVGGFSIDLLRVPGFAKWITNGHWVDVQSVNASGMEVQPSLTCKASWDATTGNLRDTCPLAFLFGWLAPHLAVGSWYDLGRPLRLEDWFRSWVSTFVYETDSVSWLHGTLHWYRMEEFRGKVAGGGLGRPVRVGWYFWMRRLNKTFFAKKKYGFFFPCDLKELADLVPQTPNSWFDGRLDRDLPCLGGLRCWCWCFSITVVGVMWIIWMTLRA